MSALISRATGGLDRWIHGLYAPDAGTLGLYRIFFALWMLFVIPLETRFIEGFPESFFHPALSLVRWLPAFPPVAFFEALDAAAVVFGCALLLGYRTRAASLLFFACLVVGKSFVFAFGKSIHSILDFVPLVMAFSAWGDRYSLDAVLGRVRRGPRATGAPLAMMALLLGFGMFTAGFEKLLFGWLGFGVQASYAHALLYESLGLGWIGPGSIRDLELRWLFEIADWFVVLLEVGFLFAILNGTTLRMVCTLAAVFHFNNVLFLQIPSESFAALYPLFFPWTRLEARVGPRVARVYAGMATRPLVSLAGACAGVAVVRLGVSTSMTALGDSATAVVLALAAAVWGTEIVLGVRYHIAWWRSR